MGILNVTPDSFSDGGRYLDPERAVEHALRMIEEGADFIDVGGESTRPRGKSYAEGAEPVDEAEELRRVLPVVRHLAGKTDVPISVDTCKSSVAKEALAAGATIVNDVTGLHADRAMAETVAAAGGTVVLMHMRGTPRTMQSDTRYADLFGEITAYLEESIALARGAGIGQAFVDPGIGFGKNLEQNLQILGNVGEFHKLGCPLLVGPSRKSFIGAILDLPVEERLEGTLGAAVALALQGVHVVRIHDVRAAARALRVSDAIRMSSLPIME
jgi:dihydropteroate synthase